MISKAFIKGTTLLLLGVLIGVEGVREYERLAYGFRLNMLSYHGNVETFPDFTFGAGPAFGFYTNGRYEFRYRDCEGHYRIGDSPIVFDDHHSVRCKLIYSLTKYVSDIEQPPAVNLTLPGHQGDDPYGKGNVATVFYDDLKPLLSHHQDIATMKLVGTYFTTYVSLQGIAAFPKTGVFSIIVH